MFKQTTLKIIENEFRRRIFVAVDFVEHHFSFFFDFFLGKSGMKNHDAQKFQRPFEVVFEKEAVNKGFFLAGAGIQFSATAFRRLIT